MATHPSSEEAEHEPQHEAEHENQRKTQSRNIKHEPKHLIERHAQPPPVKRHIKRHEKASSYRVRREREIDENIAALTRQGLSFHYNRDRNRAARRHFTPHSRLSSETSTSPSESSSGRAAKAELPNLWRLIFMLCCLSVIFYYVIIYIF